MEIGSVGCSKIEAKKYKPMTPKGCVIYYGCVGLSSRESDIDGGVSLHVLDVNLTSPRGHGYWVASCIPVVCVEGTWVVEDKHIAGGTAATQRENCQPVYLHGSLEYITLGTFLGPDEVNWTTGDMGAMIAAFDTEI